uniref:Uncharacterized protein n=1 Tax=Glossina pallidipes TaxID=7398 RepID=A0A1A9ZKZ0_GLOPL
MVTLSKPSIEKCRKHFPLFTSLQVFRHTGSKLPNWKAALKKSVFSAVSKLSAMLMERLFVLFVNNIACITWGAWTLYRGHPPQCILQSIVLLIRPMRRLKPPLPPPPPPPPPPSPLPPEPQPVFRLILSRRDANGANKV